MDGFHIELIKRQQMVDELHELIYDVVVETVKKSGRSMKKYLCHKESCEIYLIFRSLLVYMGLKVSIKGMKKLPNTIYSVGDGRMGFVRHLGDALGKQWYSIDPHLMQIDESVRSIRSTIQDVTFLETQPILLFIHSHVAIGQSIPSFPNVTKFLAVSMDCCLETTLGYDAFISRTLKYSVYSPDNILTVKMLECPYFVPEIFRGTGRMIKYSKIGLTRKHEKTKNSPAYHYLKLLPFHNEIIE